MSTYKITKKSHKNTTEQTFSFNEQILANFRRTSKIIIFNSSTQAVQIKHITHMTK